MLCFILLMLFISGIIEFPSFSSFLLPSSYQTINDVPTNSSKVVFTDVVGAFKKWDSEVGCVQFKTNYVNTQSNSSMNSSSNVPSLQEDGGGSKCGGMKMKHVSILVKGWNWIPDNLNNLYSCSCELSCLWTKSPVLADNPDALLFETAKPSFHPRSAGQPLRVFVDLEPSRKRSGREDIFISYHAKDDLQSTYAGALFHNSRNYYVSPYKNNVALVYWSSSNCVAQRNKLAHKFLSLLPHHSFGKCLNNVGGRNKALSLYPKCANNRDAKVSKWWDHLHCVMSHYKFVLAIENTWTESYVTEKLFYALDSGAVPIYFGAPNVMDFVPPHSIIDGTKFSSMEELASYVKVLANDPVAYGEYHAWRRCGELDPMMRHNVSFGVFLIHLSFFFSSLPFFSWAQPFSVNGTVLELQESNFDSAISSFDHILVDFYAPWCGHCKRLSPELDEAAPILAALKEPIILAKLDADKFNNLAQKYEIGGYPTIMLFNHGIPTEYFGPRKADLLVRYLRKYAAADVTILESDSAVRNFVEEAGSFFPIYIGFGLNNSTIENVAIRYKKNAWFSVAKDFSEDAMVSYAFDKVPALVSLNPTYDERNTFYGPFEEKFIEDFVKQNLLPLVVPVSRDTLKMMKADGRKMVLTIVDDEKNEEGSKELIKLLKVAATGNRDLIFGYVSIKDMEEFAEKFDIGTKLPKMIIWDKSDEYLSVVGSESIDGEDQATLITKFIEGYREGRTTKKRTSGRSVLRALKRNFNMRMVYIFVCAMAVMMLMQWFISKVSGQYQRVPTQDQVGHASSSVTKVESKELKSADKED
ncbi:hypothetical protein RIF29_18440 [Crotalaria pallida]|uniref:Fucosyltransferase n=1 Tax=Crotalaria pallida TaxID=3830 RepID=A0AAN9FJ17_CROPI